VSTDALDVARALFDALNRSDLAAIAALYHPVCVVEHVFVDDLSVCEGLEQVRAGWAKELKEYVGSGPAGRRFEVHRVSGIETGWGWARVDWSSALRDSRGTERHQSGYSHFWVEDGLIRRHRSIARAGRAVTPSGPAPGAAREFPTKPVIGVGAVILTDDQRVVLVKRQHEPLAGQWSLPGGTLELGETLEAGTAREALEETGLIVDVGAVVEVFDRILVDEDGRVRFHYVLVDYLCQPREGRLHAGSDVTDVALVAVAAVASYRVTEKAQSVIEKAVQMMSVVRVKE
jgi:ADP-ribose pyrophosphatase YjhB (NUDIX family)